MKILIRTLIILLAVAGGTGGALGGHIAVWVGEVVGGGTMEEWARSKEPAVRSYFHGPRGRAASLTHAGTAPQRD